MILLAATYSQLKCMNFVRNEVLIEEFINNLIFLPKSMQLYEIIQIVTSRHVLVTLVDWQWRNNLALTFSLIHQFNSEIRFEMVFPPSSICIHFYILSFITILNYKVVLFACYLFEAMSNNEYNEAPFFRVVRHLVAPNNQSDHEQSSNSLMKVQSKMNQLKHDNVILVRKLILLFFLFILLAAYQVSQLIDGYDFRINQLQSKMSEIQGNFNELQKVLPSMKKELLYLRQYSKKLADQIIELHVNQLTKQEKGMSILKKHSTPFKLTFQENKKSFQENYSFNKKKQIIKKKSNQEVLAYSAQPIPDDNIYYFQVKIQHTYLGVISIGVLSQQKLNKDIDCGFCMSNQMYYIFCKNGQVYHGETLQYYKHSKKSRFSKIRTGDVVSMFVDQQLNQLIWYVNGKYALSQYLDEKMIGMQLYPFILMAANSDEVIILT